MRSSGFNFLLLLSLGFSFSGLALDSYDRQPFNLERIKHKYTADPDCDVIPWQEAKITFIYNDVTKTINVLLDEVEYLAYSPLDNLNSGKFEFASCWSDGFKGYTENEFYNDRLVKRKIIQESGFLCNGGSVKSSESAVYEFAGNTMIMRYIYANYERGTVADRSCTFSRIE